MYANMVNGLGDTMGQALGTLQSWNLMTETERSYAMGYGLGAGAANAGLAALGGGAVAMGRAALGDLLGAGALALRAQRAVVIGENMERVDPYAARIGAETISDWLKGRQWTMALNKEFIQQMVNEGRRIIDIGPDWHRRWKDKKVSGVYADERRMIKGYKGHQKEFKRPLVPCEKGVPLAEPE
jgi:hypothetical protein